jgi:tetratricopeptide (TPR) repeat protein
VRRTILSLSGVVCLFSCLAGCAGPSAKRQAIGFKDPQKEERARYLQSELAIRPDAVESRVELGRIYLSEYMLPEAEREFRKILEFDSNFIQAYLLLSLTLQKCPNPDLTKVANLLETASEIAPDDASVHLNLAQVYDDLEKLQGAIGEFQRAIDLSEDAATSISAHLGLMAIYGELGESEKAQEHYDAAYEIYPGVEQMIRQAEISQLTPPPRYAGREFGQGSGLHPSLEKRMRHAQQEIQRIANEKNE